VAGICAWEFTAEKVMATKTASAALDEIDETDETDETEIIARPLQREFGIEAGAFRIPPIGAIIQHSPAVYRRESFPVNRRAFRPYGRATGAACGTLFFC
jgi:hypothetical protein